ncbi:MAG TPA: TraR/DksA C4-type zinc finger protein [Candidatus Atribacteria bacterium]|nr:TraR/DksA C4-type zinc finger protein [Candidatus Atribacteria bacterium]HPZ81122.1 TraR/DksA C4-type zinc finger protein [Candidatus Atribacteria bacterium]HQE24868.1 TraR/DksA C4-type zinc finger protein [Candidatus Atribacteria bacterium]
MEAKEKEEFRVQLLELSENIKAIIQQKLDAARDYNPLSESRDEADLGSATADLALQMASQKTLLEMLKLVEKALKKIEAGTYGFCEMCKREISTQRLKAIPYALYCVECQSKIENE